MKNINEDVNYDYIIVGAGIVGLSTAYSISKKNKKAKILVLEKESKVSKHQSGNNSNVIHSGIYYKPNSEKAKNCKRGYDLLIDFLKKNQIKYEICGKIIVATNSEEEIELMKLYDRGKKNGLKNLKLLNSSEIKKKEPYVNGTRAIYVPQSGITDYNEVCKKIYKILIKSKTTFKFNSKVKSIKNKVDDNIVTTDCGKQYSSKYIINVAGLYSDKLAQLSTKVDYKIIPFRGEYYNLKDSARHLVKNLIYPVPNPDFPFLGVHFTRRVDGSIESGPNAVLAFSREGYKMTNINFKELFEILTFKGFIKLAFTYWREGAEEMYRSISKRAYLKSLQKLIPKIKYSDIVRGGSGVRAQAVKINGDLIDDFLIKINGNIVNVCNAPSPAATSCFAIGEHIVNLLKIK